MRTEQEAKERKTELLKHAVLNEIEQGNLPAARSLIEKQIELLDPLGAINIEIDVACANDADACPSDIKAHLEEYAKSGRMQGHFLTAVLEDRLGEAVARADSGNLRKLPAICCYVYNRIPSQCWGSKKKVDAWVKGGGKEGLYK